MRYILFILTVVVLVSCSSDEDRYEYSITRAKEYIAGSEYPSAAIELQNVLQLDANSAEARWLLGKIYLVKDQMPEAENQLLRAQNLGWKKDDIRPALARALLGQGNVEDVLALEHEDLNTQAASQLLASQAIATTMQGEMDEAVELITLALNKDPNSLEATLAEALITTYRGDVAGALSKIEAILAAQPQNGEAWAIKAQALLQQKKLDEARDAYSEAIAYKDVAVRERASRALINLQLQDYEAAQIDTTELLRIAPSHRVGHYLQGLLYFHEKRHRDAISHLNHAIPVAQNFPLIPFYLSVSYLVENEPDLAIRLAKQHVAMMPGNLAGRKLLATLLIQQNEILQAQNILKPALESNPNDLVALNIMANSLLLDDKAGKGLILYARLVQLQPDWRIAPLRYETDLITRELLDETRQQSESASEEKNNFPQSDILLIIDHLRKKDYSSAIAAAKSYKERDLDSLAPYHVLGMIYLRDDQPDAARDIYTKALKRDPYNPPANRGLAHLARMENDLDKARAHYETVLKKHPNDLSTLVQLSSLEAEAKNQSTMVNLLDEAIEAHPSAVEPRTILADHYLRSGAPEKVGPVFSTLSPTQQQSPRVLELSGAAQLALQQYESAVASFQQLVDGSPESIRYHYLLAIAANESGDKQKTKLELLEVIKRDDAHVLSLINLAKIAIQESEREQFEQYLATLVELAPDAPAVLRLRASSALTQDDVAAALAFSQKAFEQAPSTETVLGVATLQIAAGRHDDARNTLQQWLKLNPTDVPARVLLANELVVVENSAAAQAQYLAALEQEPDNPLLLNNLAWSLRLDNPKQALLHIRRANTLAPDQPELLDTLAVIESLNGNHKAAELSITRAHKAAPNNLSMHYHLAMIEATQGKTGQAISTLETLLASESGEFPDRPEAEKLLQTLMENKTGERKTP